MNENKTKIIVLDETGNEKEAEILSAFSIKKYNKNYILYTLNEVDENDMIKLYVAILNDKDGVYSLENITNDEEWGKVKDAMRKIAKEGQQVLKGE